MSELQNEAVELELTLSDENGNEEVLQEASPDLATGSEAEHEEQPQEVDEQAKAQEAIQKRINKKTFEAEQAKRDLEAAQAKLEAFEKAEQERLAAQVGEIPPLPDPFDDDYEAKVKARDKALLDKAEFEAQQRAYGEQLQARQQQAQAEKVQEVRKAAESYSKKAVDLGIDPSELQAAGQAVESYGLPDDLVIHILNDSDGPLITKHLAANPAEGFELARMSPYAVGPYLDSIKQKAEALKPKKSNTPPPTEKVEGSAVTPDDSYAHIKGARFE